MGTMSKPPSHAEISWSVKFITERKHLGQPWSGWPSSAVSAYGRQHYCAAGPATPLPDKYALATDKRTKNTT